MTDFELRAHRVAALTEIENIMARHSYYHAAIMNREELETLWSKEREDELVWSQNFGRWIGINKLIPYYAPPSQVERGESIKSAFLELHPEYTERLKDLDVRGLSEMSTHVLSTSVIEVSADGMSAKGVWYTPGFALRSNDPGRDIMDVSWMWEKYGADFIFENGEWKFLRLLICMDIMAGADVSDWTKPRMPMGPPPEAPNDKKDKKGASPAMGGMITVEKDGEGRFKDYSPTRLVEENPRLPEPFESLDKTWSY